MKTLDWNNLSQSKKDSIKESKPIFIWGSRWISDSRIEQLKKLAEKRKVLWGILKDDFITGLENSLQFKTLQKDQLESKLGDPSISLGMTSNIDILEYYQRDLKFI